MTIVAVRQSGRNEMYPEDRGDPEYKIFQSVIDALRWAGEDLVVLVEGEISLIVDNNV